MFGNYFYHETIRRCVSVFGTLFNNISVLRKDNSGRVLNEVKVPLAYGNKEKFLARLDQQASLQDPKIAIKLPRMSFEMTTLSYDAAAKMQKGHREFVDHLETRGNSNRNNVLGPIPYRMGLQLNIIAKNQDDALQILEQIIPFFQPQYTVTVKEVDAEFLSDYPFTLQSIQMTDEYEGDYTTRRAIVYTLDFETKVRFYGPVEERAIIKKATVNVGLLDNQPQTTLDHKTIAIVNPFAADKDETHTIIVNRFDADTPDWVQIEVTQTAFDEHPNTLLDNVTLTTGDFIVTTSNATSGVIGAINGKIVDVINIDGRFDIGEKFYTKDKKMLFEIINVIERWVPYV